MARPLSATTHAALEAAVDEVLYERGLHRGTVDEICARAGVGKPALYRHFGDRDGVVVDYLARRRTRRLGEIEVAVAAAGADPVDRARAVVGWMADWITANDFAGCGFHRAVQQRADGADAVVATTRAFKAEVEDRLHSELAAAGVDDADRTARHLFLLIEGALATAAYRSAAGVAADLRQLADEVLARSAS